ncbi:MAG: phosphatidate cytidylyltransferase [Spirochaetaceae bacterium]|nr:phosphatidate cytidylyltransferase [Spirochaetaceae bacterium]
MSTIYQEKAASWNSIKGELLRKSLHLLISFVPLLASINLRLTLYLLSGGVLFFTIHEYLRLSGMDNQSILSKITELASRDRDRGHIVLGPITLGLGAILALLFYPNPAASIAIYALAFGDGLASLSGKLFGRTPLIFIPYKSLEGSLTCFLSVFIASFAVTRGQWLNSLILAISATVLEALPIRDLDNVVIPLGVGLIALLLGV